MKGGSTQRPVAAFGEHVGWKLWWPCLGNTICHTAESVAPESSHKRGFDVPFAFFSHIWEIHVYQIAFLH